MHASAGGGDIARGEATVRDTTDGLSDEDLRRLIEECDYFQEPLLVTIPKSVWTNLMNLTVADHPGLLLAANMGLVEFDPPFDASTAARHISDPSQPGREISVKLGANASGVPIADRGNEYQLELGRRRVERLQGVTRTPDRINMSYRWTVEAPGLLYFAPDHSELWGGAEFRRTETGWKSRVWRNTRTAARMLCSEE